MQSSSISGVSYLGVADATFMIPCEIRRCPANLGGYCARVQAIRVDRHRLCRCRLDELVKGRPELAIQRSRCIACGLEIVKGLNGEWLHIGVSLKHPAAPEAE